MDTRTHGAPSLPLYLTEPARAMAEYAALWASVPLVAGLPRGDGQPVLVLPGLLADDGSTRPLRRILRGLGYDVHGWRLGRNIGPTAECVDGIRECLDRLHESSGRPVSLIGWSLGGIYARRLARETPESVRQVVTLGSPFRMARTDQSRAHRAFQRFSHLHVESVTVPLDAEEEPLRVPATSIYSRFDGVVAWESCLDLPGVERENIAVTASHLGMGHHPAVVHAVADRLAQPAGAWAPYRPPAMLRHLFPRPDVPEAAETLAFAAA